MNITNVRLGCACNSSALHSIVIVHKPGIDQCELDMYQLDFGTDDFILASPELKSAYLAATLYANLIGALPPNLSTLIVRELLANKDLEVENSCINHQGLIRLPFDYNEQFIHLGFLTKLNEFLSQNSIAIVGGSDNDIDYRDKVEAIGQPVLTNLVVDRPFTRRFVARYDQAYDYFTLFNRDTGARIRLSFHDAKISRSSTPELVDLKITDYCPFACSFCYQDSVKSGTHASYSTVCSIIYRLSTLEVFEVAIGGGEPTFHPQLEAIARYCLAHNIVPNLTTKNLNFLQTGNLSYYGSVAYSIASHQDFLEFIDVYGMLPASKQEKLTINIIAGITDSTYSILYECSNQEIPVTILGFKGCGRGLANYSQFNQQDSDDILKQVDRLRELDRFLRIGVDTVFANQYQKEIQELIQTNILFDTVDGAFSCYIDAVNQTMYRDSYSGTPHISLKSVPIDVAYAKL